MSPATTRRPLHPVKRGRPKGSKDRKPRKARADKPSRRDEVHCMRAKHPKWSAIAIGEALGMTRQAVYYHLRPLDDSDGESK